MKNRVSSTSFEHPHSPSRYELNEYMENTSSFNRAGLIKPKAMLSRQTGRILNLEEFLLSNTQLSKIESRVANPNETRVLLTNNFSWKQHTTEDRAALKLARYKHNLVLRMEGVDPKKWKTIVKIEC